MATVLPFQPRALAAEPAATFDRTAFRARIEAAAGLALDFAHYFIDLLDRIDGDPDFEPDADAEDDGIAEPMRAALVGAISQIQWVGFEGGAV